MASFSTVQWRVLKKLRHHLSRAEMRRGALYCRVGMGVVVRRASGFCLALCKVEMSCSMLVRRVVMPVEVRDVRWGMAWCYIYWRPEVNISSHKEIGVPCLHYGKA